MSGVTTGFAIADLEMDAQVGILAAGGRIVMREGVVVTSLDAAGALLLEVGPDASADLIKVTCRGETVLELCQFRAGEEFRINESRYAVLRYGQPYLTRYVRSENERQELLQSLARPDSAVVNAAIESPRGRLNRRAITISIILCCAVAGLAHWGRHLIEDAKLRSAREMNAPSAAASVTPERAPLAEQEGGQADELSVRQGQNEEEGEERAAHASFALQLKPSPESNADSVTALEPVSDKKPTRAGGPGSLQESESAKTREGAPAASGDNTTRIRAERLFQSRDIKACAALASSSPDASIRRLARAGVRALEDSTGLASGRPGAFRSAAEFLKMAQIVFPEKHMSFPIVKVLTHKVNAAVAGLSSKPAPDPDALEDETVSAIVAMRNRLSPRNQALVDQVLTDSRRQMAQALLMRDYDPVETHRILSRLRARIPGKHELARQIDRELARLH